MILKIIDKIINFIGTNCNQNLPINKNFKIFIESNTEYILKYIFKKKYIKLLSKYNIIEEKKDKCIICNKIYKIINEYLRINNFEYIYFDKKFKFETLFIIKKCNKIIFNSYYLNSSSKIPKKFHLYKAEIKGKYEIKIYYKYNIIKYPIKPDTNDDIILKNQKEANSNFIWDTSTPTLFYNDETLGKCPIILTGVSITTMQYLSSLFSADTFYDFTTNSTNANLTSLANYLKTIPITLNTDNISKLPCLRIPMCADYWLYGSAPESVVNTYFTSQQYQNAIIDIINQVYNSVGKYLTVILDLHWNYSTSVPQQSYNGTGGNNFNSGQQLPLCGVFLSDTSTNTTGTLDDNTLDFWMSISNVFGVDASGIELNSNNVNSEVKSNIFFELYNEPYCERLVNTPNGAYIPQNMYNTKYDLYINGGEAYLNYTYQKFSFTGLGVIYNELRNMGCYNVCVFSSAENYAYFDFTGGDQWNYYYEGIDPTIANTLKNTYNCFTCLRDAVENNNDLYVKNPSGGNYSPIPFENILLNSHPYSGLYSGAMKLGGYHNPTLNDDPNNNIPGYAQIISSFQNSSMNNFYMSSPHIVTEYGQFDLPWSDYSSGTTDKTSSDFAYPDNYKNPLNATLGTPYYNGTWYDENNVQNIGAAIIPYFHNFISFNVSFTVWAWRPNSGGIGDAIGCNTYAPGYGWAATQPDFVSGSFSYSGNVVNGNGCAGTLQSQIISSTTQDLNLEENLGCQGPDFAYLSDTYII